MKVGTNLSAWLVMSLVLVAPVIAAAADPVTSTMGAYRVLRMADGSEKLEKAQSVVPGDLLEYQVTYENAGDKPVRDLQVNVAVPPGTTYVDGSAAGAAGAKVSFSADGGKTYAATSLKRKSADGKSEEMVPPVEYSNLQWRATEPLSKGKAQKYVYRVRVKQ